MSKRLLLIVAGFILNLITVPVFADLPPLVSQSFSPSSLIFPTTPLGTTSVLSIQVSNGAAPYHLDTPDITGGAGIFSQTTDCPALISAYAQCKIAVSFTPTTVGDFHAVLNLLSLEGEPSSQDLPISARSVASGDVQVFSPSVLSFPPTALGSTSELVLEVTNGDSSYHLDTPDITHSAGVFTQSNDCPEVIPPHGVCHVFVRFSPTSVAEYHAVLNLLSLAGEASSQDVPINGSAIADATTSVSEAILPLMLKFAVPEAAVLATGNFTLGLSSDRNTNCYYLLDEITVIHEASEEIYSQTHAQEFSALSAGDHSIATFCKAQDGAQASSSFAFSVSSSSAATIVADDSVASNTSFNANTSEASQPNSTAAVSDTNVQNPPADTSSGTLDSSSSTSNNAASGGGCSLQNSSPSTHFYSILFTVLTLFSLGFFQRVKLKMMKSQSHKTII